MKNYYYYTLLALMAATAPSAMAEVTSMKDLYGTYKFTATMTVTDAGKSFQTEFSNDCEVKIEESSNANYQAQIVGFAGATGTDKLMTRGFDATACTFSVPNPGGNNYMAFSGDITIANAQGAYPYANGNSPELTFTFDPESQNMTVNDFTIVGGFDYTNSTCSTYATFTNVKLTLVEAATTKLADLTGTWEIVAGTEAYSTYSDSTLPTSYLLTLTQTSEGVYTAKFDIEGVKSFTLDATFDGNKLSIPFDNTVIDADNNIVIKDFNTGGDTGAITFKYSDSKLTGTNPLYIAQSGMPLQWWANVTGAPYSDFSWEGTYKVTTKNLFNIDGATWDNPFEFTVEQKSGKYIVTSFLGHDTYSLNTGSMALTIADDNKSASICIDGVSNGYGAAFLYMDSSYNFYSFRDGNGAQNPLTLTRNDDGTITMSDFGFYYGAFGSTDQTSAAWYIGNTITEKVSGVSTIAVDDVKANIQVVGNEIVLDGVQLVTVYDLSGRVAYQGATSVVSGLNRGIYVVKVNNTVAKVSLR